MCGFVAFHQPDSADYDLSALATMTHVLAHRGPDDFGFGASAADGFVCWKDQPPSVAFVPGVAMGHRRLSILDLSDAGRQPLVSADGRYALVYNGEVYNYRELRAELERHGRRFATQTDTEVVLQAYAQWGTGCFARFNGMWALVLWDAQRRELVACRDRVGVKPLYRQRIGKAWVYASEVKAILAHERSTRGVEAGVLAAYLADVGQPHGGQTFYRDVEEVQPGTCIVASPTATRIDRYWTLPQQPSTCRSIDEAAEALEALLVDTVRLRMRSDVRVGTMLSGGMDSTTVISMMRQQMRSDSAAHRATGDTLQAFTAIYPDSSLDEEPLVDELCRTLELRANKVYPLQQHDLDELLRVASWHMERPYFNSVPLVHTLLMRLARSVGVKVVLNGHGSDEMLGGYPSRYIPEAIGDSITGGRWIEAWQALIDMRDIHGLGRRRALTRALETRLPTSVRQRRMVEERLQASTLSPVSRTLAAGTVAPAFPDRWQGGLQRALFEDFFYQSLPTWLHLEDRISMAESIEAREPFLDYRIVELAFSLPNQFKVGNGVTKRVLRHAMKGRLPEAIVANSRKTPFSGPDAAWLRGPLRRWVERAFIDGDARVFEFVEPTTTRAMLRGFIGSEHSPTHPYAVWKLVSTEVWLRSLWP